MVNNSIQNDIFDSINHVNRSARAEAREAINWLKGTTHDLLKNESSLTEGAGTKWPKDPNRKFITSKLDITSIGRMFMYMYDPKHKNKLPYYDTLPLIILVEFTKDGFYGLNLHYVPPFVREKIINELQSVMNKSTLTEAKKTKLNYMFLKNSVRFDIIKPCFKRYLFSHIRSNFMFIDPTEWGKSIMLPTERFKKATKTQVFRDFINNDLKNTIRKRESNGKK
jgi:hypothetical protein